MITLSTADRQAIRDVFTYLEATEKAHFLLNPGDNHIWPQMARVKEILQRLENPSQDPPVSATESEVSTTTPPPSSS